MTTAQPGYPAPAPRQGDFDPHWAAAVSERFCPRLHGPLKPWTPTCRSTELWLRCPTCNVSYIPRPEGRVGMMWCTPNGYCYQKDLRRQFSDYEHRFLPSRPY